MESEGVKPTAPDMGKTGIVPFPKSALGKPGVSVGCKETYQPPEEKFTRSVPVEACSRHPRDTLEDPQCRREPARWLDCTGVGSSCWLKVHGNIFYEQRALLPLAVMCTAPAVSGTVQVPQEANFPVTIGRKTPESPASSAVKDTPLHAVTNTAPHVYASM
jgi:hypothetical protein